MRGIECACHGAIGSDNIELKISKADKPWASFNLAVDTGEEKPQWLRVSCFGETAERVSASFKKNDRAYIEGLIRLDHWTDKHGEQKHGLSVSAFKVEKVGVSAIGRNKPKREADQNNGTPSFAGSIYQRELNKIVGRDDFQDAMPI
jgi:single-stranded DNA-binding protein